MNSIGIHQKIMLFDSLNDIVVVCLKKYRFCRQYLLKNNVLQTIYPTKFSVGKVHNVYFSNIVFICRHFMILKNCFRIHIIWSHFFQFLLSVTETCQGTINHRIRQFVTNL